jgi:dihydrolipoamide dehydrogenase
MDATASFDLIVIGGGPAGVTAALRARELGASVALIERGSMGGTCTNDGCVPTRVLARAARLMANAAQYDIYGITISQPELDFRALLARAQAMVYDIHEKKQLIGHLETSGAQVFTGVGPARFVDPHTVEIPDGRRFRGERFVLAAGGRARRMDFPGEELALTHSDIWRLQKLPASVVIVGGAATGCQLATIFNAFGSRVTVLEVAPRILAGEDRLVSEAMLEAFRKRGIGVIAGIGGIDRLERAGVGGLRVTYRRSPQPSEPAEASSSNDLTEWLVADAVILSTGWLGNLDGLNLAAAGVETDGRYVVTDDTLRTSAPHIYAAGDIDGRMMLVQSAGHEARIAAENAVLGGHGRREHLVVPHGGFTDPEYASVGPTEEQARRVGDVAVAVVQFADLDRAVIDSRTEGFCKLIVDRETHRLVAAHVVGEQALEVVHVAAAGMAAGMRVEALAEMQIAYPTFTAILGLGARRLVAELGVTPLAHEWRALGRAPAEWERSA